MWTPWSASSAALVRVSMLSAALAMLVCGWPAILLRTANRPSTAVTLTTYRRGRGEASSRGSSRSQRSAGARALTSWVSRTSAGSRAPSRADQEFSGDGSGSSPASSASRSTTGSAAAPPSIIRIGVKPGACRAPSGSASRSPAASRAYDCGGRRTVCAALLTRMSRGSPVWRNSSHRPSTWRGSRRSTARTVSRSSHFSLPGSARKRRTASCGNREVTSTSAPSRSIISASWKPIFTRPPVSSTRRPLKSVLNALRAELSAAHAGHSRW